MGREEGGEEEEEEQNETLCWASYIPHLSQLFHSAVAGPAAALHAEVRHFQAHIQLLRAVGRDEEGLQRLFANRGRGQTKTLEKAENTQRALFAIQGFVSF